MNDLQKRIYHILLGIAYGDSLGMPSENLNPQQIKKEFGYIDKLTPSGSIDFMNRNFKAGKVTDDTENTIFICNMLIETGGEVNKEIFVKHLTNWLETDPDSMKVTGPSTLRAIQAIKNGESIDKAGINGTTNGAAMKIAPIGMLQSYKNLQVLVQQVAEICIPTHNTQIAIQGAAVVATAVSYGLYSEKVDWNKFYSLIMSSISEASQYGNPLPSPSITKRIKFGKYIADNYNETAFLDTLYSFLGTGLETLEIVPAAITLVYRNKGNLKATLVQAANIGGDTDTLGAICGAICAPKSFNLEETEINKIKQENDIAFRTIASKLSAVISGRREK